MNIYQELDREMDEAIHKEENEVIDEVPKENLEYEDDENPDDALNKLLIDYYA
jgi:hypothetical protein